MPVKKRGLGRGLEALLAGVLDKDDSSDDTNRVVSGEVQDLQVAFQTRKERSSLSTDSAIPNGQADMAPALISNIHRETFNLLQEAESLKKLIDEIELIVRAEL